jgi:hypothetical protein
MSNITIALLLGMGGGFLIYNRLMRTTGNNRSSSIIAGTMAGLLIFIFLYVILRIILG